MPDTRKILFFDPVNTPPRHDPVTPQPSESAEILPDAAHVLSELVRIIRACGQDPVTQLSGFLITDDPTYLPDFAHARGMADQIGRDKLLETLIAAYLESDGAPASAPEPVL